MLLDSLRQQFQSGRRANIHQCLQTQVFGHEKCISPAPFHDFCDELHIRRKINQVFIIMLAKGCSTVRRGKTTNLTFT
jgi:hypothetical protein